MYSQNAAPPRQPFYLKTGFLFWGILFLSLLPWFVIHIQQPPNSDALWLTEALRRVLAGGKMTDVAFEQNPPFNMLIYILPVLAQSVWHVPLHFSLFLQTSLIVACGAAATYSILNRWYILRENEAAIITAAFVFTETLFTLFYYGERDHMLAAFLLPFVLLQISLTFGYSYNPKIKWPVFILGSFLILIKPHNGLLPTLLLIHRVWVRRNLSVLKDADFLSLAASTIIYVAITAFFFPDYIKVILPDALRIYVPLGGWSAVAMMALALLTIIFVTGIITYLLPIPDKAKNMVFFLTGAAGVNLIAFITQGKGLHYQALPVIAFLMPAVCLLLYNILLLKMSSTAFVFSLCIMTAYTYLYVPMLPDVARYRDYPHLPVSKILAEECPHKRQCHFFLFNRDMGVIHETAYYNNAYSSSRFASLWFIPVLVKAQKDMKAGHPATMTRTELNAYYNHFAGMVADDFARQKPDVAIVWTDKDLFGGKDFVSYFSDNRNFRREWSHYKKIRTQKIDLDEYYKGIIGEKNTVLPYAIYRRISP